MAASTVAVGFVALSGRRQLQEMRATQCYFKFPVAVTEVAAVMNFKSLFFDLNVFSCSHKNCIYCLFSKLLIKKLYSDVLKRNIHRMSP